MRNSKSRRLFSRASRVLVGGVNSPVRAFKAVGGSPVFVAAGAGARLTDVDGNRYIDYCGSWGPLILGHARREVVAAARRALERGSTFGAATEGEIALGEAIKKALPSMQLVRLTSSGTEAVMSAVRAARAFTKRDVVVKFAGCYHGHVDSLLVRAGSGAITLGVPDSAGVPRAWAETTINLPYNDAAALEDVFAKHGERIAAVIVEPFVGNMGVVSPRKEFVEALRGVPRRHGALLIFDEVITGFRLCYGGAQTLLGVEPDLTTLGKIVGGGLPLAAYGGRRDVMELVAPLGPVYQAGTLSGNPVAVAAGLAALGLLKKENPYARLDRMTAYLARGLADAAGADRARVQAAGSMFTAFFCSGEVFDYDSAMKADRKAYARFFNRMLARGIYLPPAQFEAAFVSSAHKTRDLDATIAAARESFRGL